MTPENFELADLINLEDWKNIQRSLSEVLDITVSTFSPEGNLLFRASRTNRLFEEILPKISNHNDFCYSCFLDSRIQNIKDIKEEVSIGCHFDLNTFIVPIRAVGDKTIAYLILGPVILKSRKNIAEYAREAEKFGLKSDEIWDALIEINVFSYNKMNAVVKLAKDVFSQIAQTGYHKRRLAEITPEFVDLGPLFYRYYEEQVLNSLLNCCILALSADSGSVMTLDKTTDMLHIKVASKLDEEVVNKAELRLGEGIAGMAAAREESIILPQDKDKGDISEKMKRQYIKSSMIVPFKKRDGRNVYGVINLNILRKDTRFSEKDIVFVKELVNMASIALIPVREDD